MGLRVGMIGLVLSLAGLTGCALFRVSSRRERRGACHGADATDAGYPVSPPQTRVEAGDRQFIVQATAPTLGLDNRPKVIPAMLENTRWELRRLDQTGVPAVPAAQQAYIRLSQGRVDGFTGCNLFNGDFKRELNNRLIFLVIRGSVKKCPVLEGQERELVRALQQVRNWQLTPDQQLQFLDQAGKVLAQFEAVYPGT
jgi:heat shock protein HslJ